MSRGSEPLEVCSKCGRRIPRSKAIQDQKSYSLGTELGTSEDVDLRGRRTVMYCISCAKHGRVLEKLKKKNERKRRY